MVLQEIDASSASIDDGSPTPPNKSKKDPNDPSYAPRSPKLVLFNPRSGESETIDLSPASSVMTLEDYRRLNAKTTERGIFTGLFGGGLLTYLVNRFKPTPPSRNALVLTFLCKYYIHHVDDTIDIVAVSSSFISYSTSRALLVSSILQIRAKARAQAMANGEYRDSAEPRSSDNLFDITGMGDSPSSLASPEASGFSRENDNSGIQTVDNGTKWGQPEPRGRVIDELARSGTRPPERMRYSKGKGLEGDVEEESEMRDPYALPGLPRNQ
nr:hypothetical protein L203_05266 [Cryptococcus depauperatus CBS 7841]